MRLKDEDVGKIWRLSGVESTARDLICKLIVERSNNRFWGTSIEDDRNSISYTCEEFGVPLEEFEEYYNENSWKEEKSDEN